MSRRKVETLKPPAEPAGVVGCLAPLEMNSHWCLIQPVHRIASFEVSSNERLTLVLCAATVSLVKSVIGGSAALESAHEMDKRRQSRECRRHAWQETLQYADSDGDRLLTACDTQRTPIRGTGV